MRASDMSFDGRIVLTDAPRLKLSANELKKYQLQDGAILITRTGATIGKCALYEQTLGPAIPSAYLIRFRMKRELIRPDFALLVLQSLLGQELLVGGAKAVAQPNVNATTISAFSIPVPPLAEQAEIVDRVNKLNSLADHLHTRYEKAKAQVDKLGQAVLAKAFRDALVMTAAELARREGRSYQTAEQLLAHTKAQSMEGDAGRVRRRRVPSGA